MRETLAKLGAPRDMFQCVETPSIPLTNYLMSICDLTMATGGKPMVQAAYSSGKPAYGVGAGNATMVIDADADVAEAAMNSRISKTSDFGSGCSADGNLIISENIYDEMKAALISEGGYLCNADEKALLAKALWKEDGGRRIETVAITAQDIATFAGFTIPDDRKFIMVEQEDIGKEHKFSGGVDRLAADFNELGARAAKRGLRVGYEARAWGKYVRDHRDAWDIVRRANHASVGLILDSFHTLAAKVDPDTIRDIPGDKIFTFNFRTRRTSIWALNTCRAIFAICPVRGI